MSNDRFASAHEMVREYQELEKQMADPSIHEDQGKARQLGRRYAQLGPVVAGQVQVQVTSSRTCTNKGWTHLHIVDQTHPIKPASDDRTLVWGGICRNCKVIFIDNLRII